MALEVASRTPPASVDYLGAATIVGAVTSLVLYLSWAGPTEGGSQTTGIGYSSARWYSARLFVLVGVQGQGADHSAGTLQALDVHLEHHLRDDHGHRHVRRLIFLPIYLQAVKGLQRDHSGLAMLASRRRHLHDLDWRRTDHGAHRAATNGCPITGAAVVGRSAVRVLETRRSIRPYYVIALIMYAFGSGLGFTMQVVVTAVQNSVDRRHMGVAHGLCDFFRSMGRALSVRRLLGAILNIGSSTHLSENRWRAQGPGPAGPINTNDVTAIRALPEPIRSWVLEAFTRAMDDRVPRGGAVHGSGLVIAVTMREKPLEGRASIPILQRPARRQDSELASMAR
jgi:hypothetical protein